MSQSTPLAGLPMTPWSYDVDRAWVIDASGGCIAVVRHGFKPGVALAAVPQLIMAAAIAEADLVRRLRAEGRTDGEIADYETVRDLRAAMLRAEGDVDIPRGPDLGGG